MKRTFAELEREFYRNIDVSDTTRGNYVRIMRQFKRWVVESGLDINRLERADILAYKAWLKESARSETTVGAYLLVVRLFYRFAEDIGEYPNIAAGIRQKRSRHGFYKAHHTDEEVERLLAGIRGDTLADLRDYAIVHLMLSTGLRCVEVSRLSVCDIHDEGAYPYLCIRRKGRIRSNDRFGITREILEPIAAYLAARGVSDMDAPLFATHGKTGEHRLTAWMVGYTVRKRMKAAGIYSADKTAHSLRHTAAVRAIKAKVPIREVQVMLGHRRVETTELYLESMDEEMRLINPAVHALSLPSPRGKETGIRTQENAAK